jgi:Cu-Zn family superoxide dismutase
MKTPIQKQPSVSNNVIKPQFIILFIPVLLLFSCGQNKSESTATAKAIMEPASGSNVKGTATFTDEGGGKVSFELVIENLSPGEHAVHIHEKGDCSAADASSAGGHWNPTMKPHGKRGSGPCHKGDIGNMVVDSEGKGTYKLVVEGWSIGGPDSTNVVGKAVIVHEKADDFTSQPAGNAGARIACGVIQQDTQN